MDTKLRSLGSIVFHLLNIEAIDKSKGNYYLTAVAIQIMFIAVLMFLARSRPRFLSIVNSRSPRAVYFLDFYMFLDTSLESNSRPKLLAKDIFCSLVG